MAVYHLRGGVQSRPGLFYFPQYDIFIEVVHYASFVFPIPVSQGPKSEYNLEQEGIDVIVECSGKTSATEIPSVAVCEAGDRCRCGQIGDIRLAWAVYRYLEGMPAWRMFCRKHFAGRCRKGLLPVAQRLLLTEQWRGEIKEGDARKRRLKCSLYIKSKNLKAIHNRNACCRCAWASGKSSYISQATRHPSFMALTAARYFLETGSSAPATVTLSGPVCSTADLRTR